MDKKIANLIAYCQGIYKKENGIALYEKYLKEINTVTPQEVFLVMNEQLKMGVPVQEILVFLDKIIKTFQTSMETYVWTRPKQNSFLYYLRQENEALLEILQTFKRVIKSQNMALIKKTLPAFLDKVNRYNDHYLKLENILFPYMEKKKPQFEGLKIMWALHDGIRQDLKETTLLLEDENVSEKLINVKLGNLYFKLYGVVQKQELILFPTATEIFNDDEFNQMHRQSFDFEFANIGRPKIPHFSFKDLKKKRKINSEFMFKTETGSLNFEQLELMLGAIPVDMTYVDENDKVTFFSRPKERLFTRSAAIIGRDVRNCHPPSTVHVVEKIIASFKDGTKDHETFWIQIKDKFVLIQYFAMRNKEDAYKGTLEVSQEISEIKSLEGEKRLLD